MSLTFAIIDDEPLAHTLIESFARKIDYLTHQGNCHNAEQAKEFLAQHQVDFIFLDIHMPQVSGFEFLQSLSNPPKVIIISAHKEYALESYEYAISDYLLKPFDFERFEKAVRKVSAELTVSDSAPNPTKSTSNHIFIKDEKKHHKVPLTDIRFIKANGNFTSIELSDGHIISQMKISDFEKLLPAEIFCRVHRSYLVALNAVTLFTANELTLGDITIPVGRVYKPSVKSLLANIEKTHQSSL
ncbi:LytR/AlgR family response regulator transcription factor [Psychrobium sp. nBUS_13]|uniref:LytR/AlgR family response regulator transcription factor n=1 Tax=Psychrobium sp. nBUS_13 TaxID=3395319 RepID=UPI003EB79574